MSSYGKMFSVAYGGGVHSLLPGLLHPTLMDNKIGKPTTHVGLSVLIKKHVRPLTGCPFNMQYTHNRTSRFSTPPPLTHPRLIPHSPAHPLEIRELIEMDAFQFESPVSNGAICKRARREIHAVDIYNLAQCTAASSRSQPVVECVERRVSIDSI